MIRYSRLHATLHRFQTLFIAYMLNRYSVESRKVNRIAMKKRLHDFLVWLYQYCCQCTLYVCTVYTFANLKNEQRKKNGENRHSAKGKNLFGNRWLCAAGFKHKNTAKRQLCVIYICILYIYKQRVCICIQLYSI